MAGVGRVFRSFSVRFSFFLCLAYGIVVGLLMILVAIHVTPVIRHDYEHRAEAAIKTSLAHMSDDDRAALRAGRAPGVAGADLLQQALRANGFSGVIFWRNGSPAFNLGDLPAGVQAEKAAQSLEKRSGRWRKGTFTIKLPGGVVLLTMANPDRPADPVTVSMPYSLVRTDIGKVMQTFINPPLIAAFVGLLLGIFIMRYLNSHLRTISGIASRVAAGRLRTPVPVVPYEDSMGQLYLQIRNMQENLRSLVRNLLVAAEDVENSAGSLDGAAREASRSSQSVAATMGDMSHGVAELAANIRHATEIVADMATQINRSSHAAETVTGISQETLSSTQSGLEVVTAAVERVNALTTHVRDLAQVIAELRNISAEIGEVVEFIEGVSEQTNLLALNASIEAAHAGEFGVTFSVLAERIQGLSADAAEAGAKIGKHIQQIMEGIGRVDEVASGSVEAFMDAADRVSRAGEFFTQIEQMVKEITIQSESVAQNAAELIRRGEDTSEKMQNIAAFSQEMAASVEEVAASAEEQAATSEQVGKTANELAKLAKAFREMSSAFEI